MRLFILLITLVPACTPAQRTTAGTVVSILTPPSGGCAVADLVKLLSDIVKIAATPGITPEAGAIQIAIADGPDVVACGIADGISIATAIKAQPGSSINVNLVTRAKKVASAVGITPDNAKMVSDILQYAKEHPVNLKASKPVS